jgi:toxin YoeB
VLWQDQDPKTARKINELLEDVRRDPFRGIGKPEPLRHALKGYWSRRINQEHRLVYMIKDGDVLIASCRYHYEK